MPGLCNHLQEAASRHSVVLGISIGDLGRDRRTWVLGRLQLRLERQPREGDEVAVTTWPSRLRSYFVLRDFLVEGVGGEVAARATSTWFVIDVAKRRAVRIPESIRRLTLPERERALDESWGRLARPERADRRARFAVRRSDLDVNDHVNHVRYVEWALATLEPEFHRGRRPIELVVDFLAELRLGDTVATAAQLLEDGATTAAAFTVSGERTGIEAARMTARWVAEG